MKENGLPDITPPRKLRANRISATGYLTNVSLINPSNFQNVAFLRNGKHIHQVSDYDYVQF